MRKIKKIRSSKSTHNTHMNPETEAICMGPATGPVYMIASSLQCFYGIPECVNEWVSVSCTFTLFHSIPTS